MTAIKVRAAIDADGTLRLAVPVDLPAGNAEVFVVVQPDPVVSSDVRPDGEERARSGLFVGRRPNPDVDIDAVRREINDAWKARLFGGV